MSRQPFLAQFSTPRKNQLRPSGYYCHRKNMWIDSSSNEPLIKKADLAELQTKTKVNVEEDDEATLMLGLVTKTDVVQESDDTDPRGCVY
ncbi:hypothetical protein [Salinivibrio sp. KP-1]|uniref:hypothetical protein n=1 Tax=Salinivibrio sp. KP-1 TaxID=1406902 RepID=UPI000A9619B4|nr:hypothetical protein [Salinivibrio sp. KP-1]